MTMTDELIALVAWLRDFADEWGEPTDSEVDVRGKLHRAASALEAMPVMREALERIAGCIKHCDGDVVDVARAALASLPKE